MEKEAEAGKFKNPMIGLACNGSVNVGPGQNGTTHEIQTQEKQFSAFVCARVSFAEHFKEVLNIHSRIGNLSNENTNHRVNSVHILNIRDEKPQDRKEVMDNDKLVNSFL